MLCVVSGVEKAPLLTLMEQPATVYDTVVPPKQKNPRVLKSSQPMQGSRMNNPAKHEPYIAGPECGIATESSATGLPMHKASKILCIQQMT
jgi:hypothetical protein